MNPIVAVLAVIASPFIIGLVIARHAAITADDGYEDEKGFHYGKRPMPTKLGPPKRQSKRVIQILEYQ